MTYDIPFNRPYMTGNEEVLMARSIASGHISGGGHYTRSCEELLERELGVPRVMLTTSCTDALEMSAQLCEMGPGDEVIVPTFTFVSTANAFAAAGVRPVFVDVRPDTLNLDPDHAAALITDRTRAIVPVHYGGVGCEMEEIDALAEGRRIDVIEDNAHGLFGRRGGRPLGSFGRLATQSFHETKNFTCGEGGALLINDVDLAGRAEVLRDKGTNRGEFFRGKVDMYTWVDTGSSYLPSDLLGAFLLAQLQARDEIQFRRRAIWELYARELEGWAKDNGVRLPMIPEDCEQSYHLFYMLLPTRGRRDALINHLRTRGILAVFHYVPLHTSPMGRRFGAREGDCPVAEDSSERLVRLPFYTGLERADQERVIEEVRGFRAA